MTKPWPSGRRLKIDIVVHGRFHGFALAQALLSLDHDVLVHTNYPAYIVERFGVPRRRVRSFLLHAAGSRLAVRLKRYLPLEQTEKMLHSSFGGWAARGVRADADLVYGFSGVMEELLRTPKAHKAQLRVLSRGSAHIREQAKILACEEKRCGTAVEQPSEWMICREEREYGLADHISVLSTFAETSFRKWGVEAARCSVAALGVDIGHFQASDADLATRQERILSGAPLRILNVGTFSYQKGVLDLIEVAAALSNSFEFRFVGARHSETVHLLGKARRHITMVDRVPEEILPKQYAWADIFLFPTLHDGFAAVLSQAAASGLPIIASENCSAPDFVMEGENGWVVPIRDSARIIERLVWCDKNRTDLAHMVRRSNVSGHVRGWSTMASELVALCHRFRSPRFEEHQT